MVNDCQKTIKKFLVIVTVLIMVFGRDSKNDKSCKGVNLNTWSSLMGIILMNHFIGRPRDLENILTMIFGYWGLNLITFIWTMQGIFYLVTINRGATPECLQKQERNTIIFEIIVGFILSLPLCLFLLCIIFSSVYLPFAYIFSKIFGTRTVRFGFGYRAFRDFLAILRRRGRGRRPGQNGGQQGAGDENGEQNDGLSAAQISRIVRKCGKKLKSEDLKKPAYIEDKECPICLEQYKKGDHVVEFEECSHKFHKKCISEWLKINRYCPLCKADKLLEIEDEATVARRTPAAPDENLTPNTDRPLTEEERIENMHLRRILFNFDAIDRAERGMLNNFDRTAERNRQVMVLRHLVAREIIRSLNEEHRLHRIQMAERI